MCRHGFGYSVFEHYETDIASEMTTYVAMDAPVKFVVVKLRNHSRRPRRLSLTGYWELVLGEWRHANQMHIVTQVDPHSGALLARNAYGRECANRVVFAQVSGLERKVTGNRTEFIGRNGSLASPAAMRRKRYRAGPVRASIRAPRSRLRSNWPKGRSANSCSSLARPATPTRRCNTSSSLPDRLARGRPWPRCGNSGTAPWARCTSQRRIRRWTCWSTAGWSTRPCPAGCGARSGYYQSGGAYGFRDQLQDTMALIHATPWLAREQLLRCAGRQFLQGDVQHWWHPPNGQGVRTHFSDDYLWLPYAACRYVLATGDTGILDESVPFLEGRTLNPEEEAYYDQPQPSPEVASLYEHCVRAIKHGLRFGEHQLPLMGCGDWNDGMNLVGRDGKGESVWLAWFLYENLQLFAALARGQGDATFAEFCTGQAALLRSNIEAHAWDGGWYRRAWFDDGTPLGSSANDECQIDSISQSWAVISSGGDPVRARQAMTAVDQRLVRRDAQLIQLLAPPFDRSGLEPGYIKGYVPGVRENGGQYTHAAIWATMAFALIGEQERAWELFAMLNPVNHGSQPETIARYQVEPYVMCADLYAAPPHTGRGGWSWYTGAAGWMYRLSLETLLGVHLEVDRLRLAPCIPADWASYQIHYRFRETYYHITVKRVGAGPGQVTRVTLDGAVIDGVGIPLVDDRRNHQVTVDLGAALPPAALQKSEAE